MRTDLEASCNSWCRDVKNMIDRYLNALQPSQDCFADCDGSYEFCLSDLLIYVAVCREDSVNAPHNGNFGLRMRLEAKTTQDGHVWDSSVWFGHVQGWHCVLADLAPGILLGRISIRHSGKPWHYSTPLGILAFPVRPGHLGEDSRRLEALPFVT